MIKRIYTLLVMSLLMAATFTVQAQKSHTFGNNDTTRFIPNNNVWNYSLTEQIFTPEEVGVTGNIKEISFFRNEKTTTLSSRMIQLFIGTTTKNSFADADDWIDPATLTRVYDGSFEFYSSKITIRFDIPFAYDGTKNLVICFHDWTDSNETDDQKKVYFQANHDSGAAKAIVAFNDKNDISAPDYTVNSGQKRLSYDRSVTTFTTSGVDIITAGGANLPIVGSYNYCISQQIFTPEEVGGKGTINALTFHDFYGYAGIRNIDIYFCTTSLTEFNGNPKLASTWIKESYMTKVYSGDVDFSSAEVTINLDNTFNYNGVDNLVLAFVDKTGYSEPYQLQSIIDPKPGEYRTLIAYDKDTPLFFSNPENAGPAYAYPFVNRVTFDGINYGIEVNDMYITKENASNFTYGLASGKIVYDPKFKTLILNNIETDSEHSGNINCRYHDDDLFIIAKGYNNIHEGEIYGAVGHTTTLIGDTFDIGYVELWSPKLPATIVIDNTTLLVNLEEGNYAFFCHGNDENNLVIKNSYVKSYAKRSNYDEFSNIALIDCEIAYPANAIVEGGYITLNGSVIGNDSVVIVPTKINDDIENITTKTFSVFPNPAETEVTLYLEPFEGTAHMTIFSADGHMMNVAELPAIDSNYRMDVSTLPAGIYYITVTTKSLRQTATIVKK